MNDSGKMSWKKSFNIIFCYMYSNILHISPIEIEYEIMIYDLPNCTACFTSYFQSETENEKFLNIAFNTQITVSK